MIRRTAVAKSKDVKVTFALPQGEPEGPVSVVGDFNDWTPGKHTLVKRANGTRSVSVTLPKGSNVHFRYLATGGRWFDDPDADRVDPDGSLLTV